MNADQSQRTNDSIWGRKPSDPNERIKKTCALKQNRDNGEIDSIDDPRDYSGRNCKNPVCPINYQDMFLLEQEYKLLKQEKDNLQMLKEELEKTHINDIKMKSIKSQLFMIKVWNIVNAMGFLIITSYVIGYLVIKMFFNSDNNVNGSFNKCRDSSSPNSCKGSYWSWFW
ncbi:unnamed protein product [Gordionus sp. m RMFG-2023]|uniref:uncharacterized protein LOC135928743 n=1 Tax=Gordionus sp. m RMFG-2023 TaxID=3053472 RepID=UPI0030DE7BEC